MNEEQAIATASAVPLAPPERVVVVAQNQAEMQRAQGRLMLWFELKGASIETELVEARANLETAKTSKWRTDGWRRVVTGLEKRREFYAKGLVALQQGYTIIPALDVDVFAIRTERKLPLRKEGEHQWASRDQSSEAPSIGDGRYVDVTPLESSERRETGRVDEKGNAIMKTWWSADEFQDVDFPLRFAKTQVLEATQHAMALKVFDEIGVLPRRRQKGDPMVVGRILLKHQGQTKSLDFLIAWFIDTRDLP